MLFEIPTLEKEITKEFLLSKNSEETYMSTYLGLPIKKGLQISPLRNDHKPTASFYRNKKGELIFHDFGIGFHGNFIDVVMYINNCSYRNALNIIGEDFGYIEKKTERPSIKIKESIEKIEEKYENLIQIKNKPFTEGELNWWKSFGVSEKTLKKFKVYSCESIFLNGNYLYSSSPKSYIFGYYGGKKLGEELWRLYFPQRKSYRFLSNWKKSMIQGMKQIPSSGDLIVLTKSLKDVMLLYEYNIPAIAPCSEVLFISNYQLSKLKLNFKNILVIYDTDLTGIHNLNKIKKSNPELKYFFIPRKFGVKDISDFYKKYGKKKTEEGIKRVREYLKI